jgi:hypothetical protein
VWILGKWEPSWKLRDPARQAGEKAGSWHQTVEEDRHSGMPQNTGDGFGATPSNVYTQSKCHCALCNNCCTNNHNMNRVLLYYLFQENKSFGSKTPFAFIFWCMGSCVKHSYKGIFYHLIQLHTIYVYISMVGGYQ